MKKDNKIRLGYFYYDLCNLYGDSGNVMILARHLEAQGAQVVVERLTVDEPKKIEKYDWIYMGSATDRGLLLALMDLKDRRHHLPSQLSGGQQQRVSIGRALFNKPGVILADEPTGNLDSRNSAEIIALLRKSNRERNQTMLIITHDESIACQCDRIITISDGKIIKDEMTGQGGAADV